MFGLGNVVSPRHQVTVMASTTIKYVHISFYGLLLVCKDICVCPKPIMCRHCAICTNFVNDRML